MNIEKFLYQFEAQLEALLESIEDKDARCFVIDGNRYGPKDITKIIRQFSTGIIYQRNNFTECKKPDLETLKKKYVTIQEQYEVEKAWIVYVEALEKCRILTREEWDRSEFADKLIIKLEKELADLDLQIKTLQEKPVKELELECYKEILQRISWLADMDNFTEEHKNKLIEIQNFFIGSQYLDKLPF